MEWLSTNYAGILQIVGAVVTLATAVVAVTPSTKDDEILGKVVKFLEYFSIVNKKTQ